jgi:hypothetical protein
MMTSHSIEAQPVEQLAITSNAASAHLEHRSPPATQEKS